MALRSRLDADRADGQSAGSDSADEPDNPESDFDLEPVEASPDPFLMDYTTDRINIKIDDTGRILGERLAVSNL